MRYALVAALIGVASAAPKVVWHTDVKYAYVTDVVTVTEGEVKAAAATPEATTVKQGYKGWWSGNYKAKTKSKKTRKTKSSSSIAASSTTAVATTSVDVPKTSAPAIPSTTAVQTTEAITPSTTAEVTTPSTTAETTPATTAETTSATTAATSAATTAQTTPAVTTPPTTSAAQTTSSAAKTYPTLPAGSLAYIYDYPDGRPTQTYWKPEITVAPYPSAFVREEMTMTYNWTRYSLRKGDASSSTHYFTMTTTEAACPTADPQYKADVVAYHAKVRALHETNPLEWDDDLYCAAWRQARRCRFEHYTDIDGRGYGQNLVASSTSVTNVTDLLQMLYVERADFDSWNIYDLPSGGKCLAWSADGKKCLGRSPGAGHFTAMLWASSSSVGCATFNCKGFDPLANEQPNPGGKDQEDVEVASWQQNTVCNYNQVGNMAGGYAKNVKRPVGSYPLPDNAYTKSVEITLESGEKKVIYAPGPDPRPDEYTS